MFVKTQITSPFRLTTLNVSKYGVTSGPYFPILGSKITPYLDTFHAMAGIIIFCMREY